MTQATSTAEPAIVQWTKGLEQASGLDALVARVQPLADALLAEPGRAAALRGMWLGHAVHPLLTDVPIGAWTSAMLLDVVGGRASRPAAQRLVGLGLLAAAPTALTGWAEWGAIAGQREKRVGVVHAAANNAGVLLYFASWRARRRGRHATGMFLALVGSAGMGLGGYLGGHLTEARKVASRHPAYED